MKSSPLPLLKIFQAILIFIAGCTPPSVTLPETLIPQPTVSSPSSYPTSSSISTPLPVLTSTSTTQPPDIPTLKPFQEPEGCQKPQDDYTIITVNGVLLNRRTYTMLNHAAEMYQGEIDILDYAITQGSYNQQVEASFGTHAGGGAVDLSVMRKDTYTILWDDIPPLINALRVSGFAAWLRDLDELYPGSPIHIHAIAIGDRDLSPAAVQQLIGDYGYFRGYSGLPPGYGGPSLDRHGDPVICQWMVEAGYRDLRPTPTPDPIGDQLDCHKCQVK